MPFTHTYNFLWGLGGGEVAMDFFLGKLKDFFVTQKPMEVFVSSASPTTIKSCLSFVLKLFFVQTNPSKPLDRLSSNFNETFLMVSLLTFTKLLRPKAS